MSSTEFNSIPPKFRVDKEREGRFFQAEKEWDRRIGNARVQAHNWRLAFFGILFFSCILVVGFILISLQHKTIPYVLEVDASSGMVTNVGTVKPGNYAPKEASIKYFLAQFVQNTRTIPLDPIYFEKNWTSASYFMKNSAATKIRNLIDKENPKARLGKETVQVYVKVIVPMTENTWQVRWTEETYNIGGGQKTSVPMTGVFTIKIDNSGIDSETTMFQNPFGIYIEDFAWAAEQK